MRFIILLAWLWTGAVLADWPIEIVPLKHQTVEQMLPMLRPFVSEGGTVTGMNGQLVIKTSPENLAQLKQIIGKFDRAPRQLRITVREGRSASFSRQGIKVEGNMSAGKNGNISIGQPEPGKGLDVQVAGSNRVWGTDADRHVRATEGMPAFIQTGVSMPVTTGYRDGWGRFHRERHYQDITSGFYVTPWVNGEQVTLEISPFSGQPLDQRGSYRKQEISTRISGRLGEWIDIGGASMQGQGGRQGITGMGSASVGDESPVSVKVELLPE
ncbi:secretin N-terminal domain-containing protein [Thiolapillus sp.]